MKENEKFLKESIDLLNRDFGESLPTLSSVMKKHQDSKINEEQYFDPNGELKKYMDKVLKQAGIRVIKYDPMKQSFHDGTWGGFYTVASSNMVDMPGHGKVKRGSAVLPVYIDKKGQINKINRNKNSFIAQKVVKKILDALLIDDKNIN